MSASDSQRRIFIVFKDETERAPGYKAARERMRKRRQLIQTDLERAGYGDEVQLDGETSFNLLGAEATDVAIRYLKDIGSVAAVVDADAVPAFEPLGDDSSAAL